MSEEWSPWVNPRLCMPKIGIIIQVRVIHKNLDCKAIFEGIVKSVTTEILVIDNMPENPSDWRVLEWRSKRPKGLTILTDILREVERDGDKVYGDRELEECNV